MAPWRPFSHPFPKKIRLSDTSPLRRGPEWLESQPEPGSLASKVLPGTCGTGEAECGALQGLLAAECGTFWSLEHKMIQQQIHPFKMPSKSNYSSDLLGEPSESNVSRSMSQPIQGSGKDEEADQIWPGGTLQSAGEKAWTTKKSAARFVLPPGTGWHKGAPWTRILFSQLGANLANRTWRL